MSAQVCLGRAGIEEFLPLGPLSDLERGGLDALRGELAASIAKGVEFASKK